MPLESDVDAPAWVTASRKPSTAGRSALAMISRSVSRASASVSRAMTKPLSPNRTVRLLACAAALTSASCSTTPLKSLPLLKYQSETHPAIRRAAVELPPWKISGCGRSSVLSGLGLTEKCRNR